jgi:hypothetical protein
MRLFSLLFGAVAFWRNAHAAAQCEEVVPGQYAGTPFANSLLLVNALSNITFFKIKDPSGQHVCTSDPASDLSFITYNSLNSTGQRLQNDAIKRLVIIISGAASDAWYYHNDILNALNDMADDDINTDNVAVLAPFFPNDSHAGTGYPYVASGLTAAAKYPSPALVWYNTDVSTKSYKPYSLSRIDSHDV